MRECSRDILCFSDGETKTEKLKVFVFLLQSRLSYTEFTVWGRDAVTIAIATQRVVVCWLMVYFSTNG